MRVKKCIKCSEHYETDKGGNICRKCAAKTAREWYYKQKAEGTLAYQKKVRRRELPYQNDRYHELAEVKRGLKQCTTREERRAFYVMMFDKIRSNQALWEYIIRFDDNHIPKSSKKVIEE